MSSNIDVLIVGAGPVGLFCAHELIRHGLTCRIIDKKESLSEHSKALGIHIRTLDLLEDCGLLNDVLKQGHKINGILFKSRGKTLINASFADIIANRHYLIDLPQNKTEAILYQSIRDKGVDVEWNTELTHVTQSPGEITATIKKPNNKIELFSTSWLIACDGAHSTVRHQVDAEFKGSAYKQGWWLADLLVNWQVPEDHMSVFINNKGPLACFPMGNKRYRLVMTAPKDSMGDPSLEDIDREFKQRSSDAATLSDPYWLCQFSIHHRQIDHYRYDRIFFAGDAAHIHSPMGGQGLNTGIQDVYNLAWKLALVEKRKAKPKLLDSYHDERFAVGHDVLKKTDIMTRMMLLTNPLLIAIRNRYLSIMSSFNIVKNFMARDIAELAISYAKSPIVHQSGRIKHLKIGEYLPTFELLDPVTRQQHNSLAITQGILHHVFIFSGFKNKQYAELIKTANTLAEKYPDSLKVHLITPELVDSKNEKITFWLDDKKEAHHFLRLNKPALFLVRPDKYVGFIQKPIDEQRFMKELYLSC